MPKLANWQTTIQSNSIKGSLRSHGCGYVCVCVYLILLHKYLPVMDSKTNRYYAVSPHTPRRRFVIVCAPRIDLHSGASATLPPPSIPFAIIHRWEFITMCTFWSIHRNKGGGVWHGLTGCCWLCGVGITHSTTFVLYIHNGVDFLLDASAAVEWARRGISEEMAGKLLTPAI